MEQLNTILGIIASVLSIAATIVVMQNKSEIKKLRDSYGGNRQMTKGNDNSQIVGHSNRVGSDDKQ